MPSDELIEKCLEKLHGEGDYGWRLLRQTWPASSVAEQRRVMARVIEEAQRPLREALKAVRAGVLLTGQLGELVDGILDA